MSIRIRAGWRSWARRTPSSPVSASMVWYPLTCNVSRTNFKLLGLSSTMRMSSFAMTHRDRDLRQALLQIVAPRVLALPHLAHTRSLGFDLRLGGFWTPTHQPLLASDTESAGHRLGLGDHLSKGGERLKYCGYVAAPMHGVGASCGSLASGLKASRCKAFARWIDFLRRRPSDASHDHREVSGHISAARDRALHVPRNTKASEFRTRARVVRSWRPQWLYELLHIRCRRQVGGRVHSIAVREDHLYGGPYSWTKCRSDGWTVSARRHSHSNAALTEVGAQSSTAGFHTEVPPSLCPQPSIRMCHHSTSHSRC